MADKQIKVPDGRGGWTETTGTVHDGGSANKDKQAVAMNKTFIEEAGTLTEKIMQFDKIYLTDLGLTKEHRAFAAALYCINLRETYPDGPEAFDQVAAAANTYYDENAPKAKR